MIVYPDDVWIVTPPKCGTTWMQEIVWHIHTDVDLEKAQLNQFYRQEIFGFEKYMMKYLDGIVRGHGNFSCFLILKKAFHSSKEVRICSQTTYVDKTRY